MARLVSKRSLGIRNVIELAVEGGIYASPSGLVHHNCNDCMRLHVMPDGVTPRLWKLSELKQSYGKRGDPAPSIINRHPHCRCALTYLSKGFGFNDKGYVAYKALDHDEFAVQRS